MSCLFVIANEPLAYMLYMCMRWCQEIFWGGVCSEKKGRKEVGFQLFLGRRGKHDLNTTPRWEGLAVQSCSHTPLHFGVGISNKSIDTHVGHSPLSLTHIHTQPSPILSHTYTHTPNPPLSLTHTHTHSTLPIPYTHTHTFNPPLSLTHTYTHLTLLYPLTLTLNLHNRSLFIPPTCLIVSPAVIYRLQNLFLLFCRFILVPIFFSSTYFSSSFSSWFCLS